MKQLQKSDLKVSEIYKLKAHNREYLYRISDMRTSMTLCNDGYLIIDTNHFNKISNISQSHDFADAKYIETKQKYEFYDATPEEKHWLEECIKANKFVSYEEAMKTFMQYYKIIESKIAMNYNNNVIHEEIIVFGHYNGNNRIIKAIETGKHRVFSTTDVLYGEIGDQKVCFDMLALEPSIKEAYDAQFKEPEFVLPEKWCVKLTNENRKTVIDYINKNTRDGLRSGSIGLYYGYDGKHCTHIYNFMNSNEITFDQFKQYVLKENTTVTEEPKVVFEEPKDKVLTLSSNYGKESIVKVECSEGGIYKIGDKIKVFTHNSPNKGKMFTIKDFRWNNTKTNLCAVTELHTPNGIGLDKIELYFEPKVEPKQELSLLEQAKLRYPVGTKFKIVHLPYIICTVANHDDYYFQTDKIVNLNTKENTNGCTGGSVYYKGQWAEIVEDFVLPEKWCVKVNNSEERNIVEKYIYNKIIFSNSKYFTKYSEFSETGGHSIENFWKYPEITFEQFKKYVLKDE